MKAHEVKIGFCIKLSPNSDYFKFKTIVKKHSISKDGRSELPVRIKFTSECRRHLPEIDAEHVVILSPSLKLKLARPII